MYRQFCRSGFAGYRDIGVSPYIVHPLVAVFLVHVYSVGGRLCGEISVLILNCFGDIEVDYFFLYAHLVNQLVVFFYPRIVEALVACGFFSRNGEYGLDEDLCARLGGFNRIHHLAIPLDKAVHARPCQLIQPKHDIYFAELFLVFLQRLFGSHGFVIERLFVKKACNRHPFFGVESRVFRAEYSLSP